MLNGVEQELLEKIQEWEDKQLTEEADEWLRSLDEWLERAFTKIDPGIRNQISQKMEQWLFYIQAAIQESGHFETRIEKMLEEARLIKRDIQWVGDLKQLPIAQLNYFAERFIGAHKITALLQGGVSGMKQPVLQLLDIPATILLNIRIVQLLSACYGYDPKRPFEMMLALKVFYASTLPKRFQRDEWKRLLNEVEKGEGQYFYEGNERFMDSRFLQPLLLQGLKGFLVQLLNKGENKNRRVLGMLASGSYNYAFARDVSDFAQRFYQYRYLREKLDKGKNDSFLP